LKHYQNIMFPGITSIRKLPRSDSLLPLLETTLHLQHLIPQFSCLRDGVPYLKIILTWNLFQFTLHWHIPALSEMRFPVLGVEAVLRWQHHQNCVLL
jgi:hypothetical protein